VTGKQTKLKKYNASVVWIAWNLDLFHCVFFVCFWSNSPQWARASSYKRFLDHTQWHTTVGRTPLDEWSAHRRDLYLTTHNTHNRQTSMPPVGFEHIITAGEWPQTFALDPTATRISVSSCSVLNSPNICFCFSKFEWLKLISQWTFRISVDVGTAGSRASPESD
jgi:hypothetical protein